MSTNAGGQGQAVVRIEHPELGAILVRRDDQGRVQRLMVKDLVLKNKEDYVGIGTSGQYTAQGMKKRNAFAGVSIATPQTVVVDGHEVENPRIVRDSSGMPKQVYIRRIYFGRTQIGTWQFVDYTASFDIEGYLVRDLLRTVKKEAGSGQLGLRTDRPPQEVPGKWAFFPMHQVGDTEVGVWVDLAHEKVFDVFETTAQRKQFAVSIAQSVCDRNGLASHGAIGGQRWQLQTTKRKSKSGYEYDAGIVPETMTIKQVFYVEDESQREERLRIGDAIRAGVDLKQLAPKAELVRAEGRVEIEDLPEASLDAVVGTETYAYIDEAVEMDGEDEAEGDMQAGSVIEDPDNW